MEDEDVFIGTYDGYAQIVININKYKNKVIKVFVYFWIFFAAFWFILFLILLFWTFYWKVK